MNSRAHPQRLAIADCMADADCKGAVRGDVGDSIAFRRITLCPKTGNSLMLDRRVSVHKSHDWFTRRILGPRTARSLAGCVQSGFEQSPFPLMRSGVTRVLY